MKPHDQSIRSCRTWPAALFMLLLIGFIGSMRSEAQQPVIPSGTVAGPNGVPMLTPIPLQDDPDAPSIPREERFRRELEAEKQKGKVLDRKFQEGLKKAKDSPDPPPRPFDYD